MPSIRTETSLTRIPTISGQQCPARQSNVHAKEKTNHEKSGSRKELATLRIGAHLRHSIRKKQNIGEENFSSCTAWEHPPVSLKSNQQLSRSPPIATTLLTLSHKIFKVMPLDIVGKVSHIDPTVLLGRIANGLHHVFFGDGAILKSGRRITTASTVRRARRSSSTGVA